MHLEGNVVVQVWEGNAVLCAHRLSDDDFVDVIELIPVLIPENHKTHHNFAANQLQDTRNQQQQQQKKP